MMDRGSHREDAPGKFLTGLCEGLRGRWLNLCRRSEVSKMHVKSNFLSLCKPLRNELSIIVFLT